MATCFICDKFVFGDKGGIVWDDRGEAHINCWIELKEKGFLPAKLIDDETKTDD